MKKQTLTTSQYTRFIAHNEHYSPQTESSNIRLLEQSVGETQEVVPFDDDSLCRMALTSVGRMYCNRCTYRFECGRRAS